MTQAPQTKFFITPSHACSYIENQQATTLFLDPQVSPSPKLYHLLSEQGFRRSGSSFYRPHCANCNACIAARIPSTLFKANKRQRRTWNKNQDLDISIVTPSFTKEHYELYERYIRERHQDGDMYPPSEEQYLSFLVQGWSTHGLFVEFRKDNQLLALAVVDRLENALSAVYTFFDPDHSNRSLGSYAILWQIDYCRQHQLPFLYLGYWIKDCLKMRYKSDYRPLELLTNGQWLLVN
ncbi:MAG: arginyltransferase [Gammaproteobacteria bacterium]|nr:arginyltransferase [Gammaproteobacteria bacterium]